jgi:type I pantothenate kinase
LGPLRGDDPYGPYVARTRDEWAQLTDSLPVHVTEEMVRAARSSQDTINVDQVRQVYLPLTELINLYIEHTGRLYAKSHDFLQLRESKTPFVVGVAGSVSVGKSTTSRLLRDLLHQGPGHPKVDLVTTDGFLFPNRILQERCIMHRKGFPESYDRAALLKFVMDVKSGVPEVTAPVYSHLIYDIVPDERITVSRPQVLIVEGLNVLQPPRARRDGVLSLALSDFFDFSVYVDASQAVLRQWYIERFMMLRETAFRDPDSFFTQYGAMDADEAIETAGRVWDTINGPNLLANILPTRGRATVILRKDAHHDIEWIRIRKV